MQTIKQPIICGTDFSEVAQEATNAAAILARRLVTTLVLIHVQEFHGIAEVDPSLFEAALSDKQALLEKEATRLRGFGVDVQTRLVSGSIFDELVNAATEMKALTMVVGAVGHGLA